MDKLLISDVLGSIANDPRTQAIFTTLGPYIPAIKREGIKFYNDVISYAVEGKWTELDEMAWEKMTNEERNALSDQILSDARDAVDNELARKQFARELILKLVGILLTLV